jgi:hypothetical protein
MIFTVYVIALTYFSSISQVLSELALEQNFQFEAILPWPGLDAKIVKFLVAL